MPNELAKEKSPYLLQHKNNPVWWKAWADKSIAQARREDKLIFLSIGYATCHWCHVMEQESFEDAGIAKLLNENYISIKVDREELPDVDQIYMDALHAMGQRGGWPLNVVLTPELKPFFGGTYFPKDNFAQVLTRLQEFWKNDREKIVGSAEQLYHFLQEQTAQYRAITTGEDAFITTLQGWMDHLTMGFDEERGGFKGAPKFPPSTQMYGITRALHLLRNPEVAGRLTPALENGATQLQEVLEHTLTRMACGGIYDHVGGGFTRYSVDERWEIPHFEKMLYVNAQLAINYLETYQLTKNEFYKNVAEDIFAYVLRDMRASGGGFFSAEDADSEGVEGKFYVWGYDELQTVLSTEELKWLETHMGVTREGNFEGENHFWSTEAKNSDQIFSGSIFQGIRKKLYIIREERERPLLDDKQLTAWNALMIWALAKAYSVTHKSEYKDAALEAALFVKTNLYKDGMLYRRYRQGQVDHFGTLDDYAYLIRASLELYSATYDESWLHLAYELQLKQNQIFADERGGYFYTSLKEKNLLVRSKDFGDNALPNSNGVSTENLAILARYFESPELQKQAERSWLCLGETAAKFPTAFSTALVGSFWLQVEVLELVAAQIPHLNGFHPFLLCGQSTTSSNVPLLQGKHDAYYLCRHGACEKPTKNWNEVFAKLPLK